MTEANVCNLKKNNKIVANSQTTLETSFNIFLVDGDFQSTTFK